MEDHEADDASSGLLRQLRKDHKLFMSEWRTINSNLAFASFNAKMITISKCPPLFKVQGQISCLVSSPCVRPAKNGAQAIDPLFCQLYFVDTAAAKESLQAPARTALAYTSLMSCTSCCRPLMCTTAGAYWPL